MNRFGHVTHFKEWQVYRPQRALAKEVFRPSKRSLDLCEEIGRMPGSMKRKAGAFAAHDDTVREEPPPYPADHAVALTRITAN